MAIRRSQRVTFSFGVRVLDEVLHVLASLELAILVILGLAAALGTGTFLESLYDTKTAQYYVYRSFWFHGLLALLGVNILFVAISRIPWKKRHIPFLLAHAGILTLLVGSWLTDRFGIDGSLRISEGESSGVVQLDQPLLVISEADSVKSIPLEWVPTAEKFKPFNLRERGLPYDLTLDQFLPHADASYYFVANDGAGKDKTAPPVPAVQLRLVGGPMRANQEFWLWGGAPSWSVQQMGPAKFVLGSEQVEATPKQPMLQVIPTKDGSLKYQARNSEGKISSGTLPFERLEGSVIEPGWKGGLKLIVQKYIPDALPGADYKPSQLDHGSEAPPSAVHLRAANGAQIWIGLGDRVTISLGGKDVDVGYLPKRIVLPFAVKLDRFNIQRYPGSMDPMSYSSQVTVQGTQPAPTEISMNEPLKQSGFTLYQASYEDARPRPVTSILSVNRDPGRVWKYLGSLMIVLGSILLFASKYRGKKSVPRALPGSQPEVRDSLLEPLSPTEANRL